MEKTDSADHAITKHPRAKILPGQTVEFLDDGRIIKAVVQHKFRICGERFCRVLIPVSAEGIQMAAEWTVEERRLKAVKQ